MKTIIRIAKTELALLFYSPIAWFLLVVFSFQCGLAYINALESTLAFQELGGSGLRYLKFLTAATFGPPNGIWSGIAGRLYLYLPLLTMGLMSREISSGTIKLLYSSPIRVREIIFGKFLAMLLYNLMLIILLLVIVFSAIINIHVADIGLLFSGLLGVYLLLCAYASIGLFMSSLTSYQVVAALSTLILFALLNYVGKIGQGIDFVRDLTYFLSISGRAEHLFLGLITTRDILYFIVIIGIFLSFSIYKLLSDRESKPFIIKAGGYILILMGFSAVGYLTSRPGFIGYLDVTATKTMTLTANTQKIIQETGNEPVEVTSYVNLLDHNFGAGSPEERNLDRSRWEQYLRFKPDIKFNYVYFYDSTQDGNLYKYNPGITLKQIAERYTKSNKFDINLFKTPAEIRQLIDLRPEQNRYVMQLKYQGRTTFLRLFEDQMTFPSETETATAFKRLLQAKMPKIAFVQGESERSIDKIGDRHYKGLTNEITFRYSLVNQGFDVETVSLKSQDIPTGIAALVIADPAVSFDTVSLRKLRRYIVAGGNLLIAGEPGKQAILNPLLQPLGVHLMEGMLVQKNKDYSPELVRPLLTPAAGELSGKLLEDVNDSVCVSMRGAAGLTYDSNGAFTIRPLLMTDAGTSWNKRIRPDENMIESAEDADMGHSHDMGHGMMLDMGHDMSMMDHAAGETAKPVKKTLAYNAEEGDERGPLPAVLALTRNIQGKQQRIIVAGDADFLSNAELGRNNLRTCNFDFSTAIFSWFSYGEFPIDSSRPLSRDTRLTLTDKSFSLLKILLLGILPGLLLVIGGLLLIRRKRQ